MKNNNDIINTIIDCYIQLGIARIVYTEKELEDILLSNSFSKIETNYIQDVRSAAFYAYGEAKLLETPILLIVDECFISSAYTALTEAWMQRLPVCIFAYNSAGYKSTLYLERCTDIILFLDDKNNEKEIVKKAIQYHGPSIVKCEAGIERHTQVDYCEILDQLAHAEYKNVVYCYEPVHCYSNLNITEVPEKHKYGILSKYLGELLGGSKSILCIPDYLLNLESNAFVQRVIPQSFKLIVKETDKELCNRFENWIASNAFSTYRKKSVKENVENLLRASTACVAFIS